MKHLSLNPHVSYGMVAGRPIFLDVSRDRYLALDPAAEEAFGRVLRTPDAEAGDGPDRARLLATRLFTLADERQPILPAEVEIPDRQLPIASTSAPLQLLDVPEIWVLLARARRGLKSRPLQQLLATLRRRRADVAAPKSAAEISALASRFHRARALVPIRPSCLQDSIALGLWLARRSACPAVIFGVKLDPFAAHCWVQTEAVILNDAPDTVSQFAPVLVIS